MIVSVRPLQSNASTSLRSNESQSGALHESSASTWPPTQGGCLETAWPHPRPPFRGRQVTQPCSSPTLKPQTTLEGRHCCAPPSPPTTRPRCPRAVPALPCPASPLHLHVIAQAISRCQQILFHKVIFVQKVCAACNALPHLHAARAGTPGFRPPEVITSKV